MPKPEGALCAYADYDPTPAPTPPRLAAGPRKPVVRRRAYEEPLKPTVTMSGGVNAPTRGPPELKPALASIADSCAYMGGISRAAFYANILPRLDTVKLGRRNFVVVTSMDRLIEASRRSSE